MIGSGPMAATYIVNPPAPERAGGEYTTNPILAVLGGTTGHQPQGDNNPLGDVPGIAAIAITAEVFGYLSGPQPGI